jgi:flagellar biosynthesis/type III secretory pathway protein FliH
MMEVKKFAFEKSFSKEDLDIYGPGGPKHPKYSDEEKRKFCDMAYEDGYEKGKYDTLNSIHQKNNAQLTVINDALLQLYGVHEKIMEKIEHDISLIAHKVLEKMFPKSYEDMWLTEINSMLNMLKDEISKHPHVTVYVNQDLVESLAEKCTDLINGLSDRVTFSLKADDSLVEADCRIDWATGGFNYEQKKILQNIYDAIDRYGITTGGCKDE